jgi:hypothetical protein
VTTAVRGRCSHGDVASRGSTALALSWTEDGSIAIRGHHDGIAALTQLLRIYGRLWEGAEQAERTHQALEEVYKRRRTGHGVSFGVWRALISLSMRRPPTDFELVRATFKRHRDDYYAGKRATHAPTFIPINIPAIAAELGTTDDSVFGRLYFHLEERYGTVDEKGVHKSLFTPKLGSEANCVNFPLLEAVLAGLWLERRRDLRTFWASTISLGIAVASLVLSVLVATGKITP